MAREASHTNRQTTTGHRATPQEIIIQTRTRTMSSLPHSGPIEPTIDAHAYSGAFPRQAAPDNVGYTDAVIELYCTGNPEFLEEKVNLMHGHLYASLSFHRIQKQLLDSYVYISSRHGKQTAIFVFRVENNRALVLNEFIEPSSEAIFRFANDVFSTFDAIRIITFPALTMAPGNLRYPRQYLNRSEDMVLELPGSIAEYDRQLGSNTRRNIKRYLQSLKKSFPTFEYRVLDQDAIPEAAIRSIIDLSCERMRIKNIKPRFQEDEVKWITDFAKRCGMVGLVTIGNRVCAGAIAFRLGDRFFMHVIAHDPQFNSYSLGIICYYLTICKGIERGGKAFHLLEGRYGYKQRLLAKKRDVAELDIYRNRALFLLNSGTVAGKKIREVMRSATQWLLHDAEHSDKPWAPVISRIVRKLRYLKRSGHAL